MQGRGLQVTVHVGVKRWSQKFAIIYGSLMFSGETRTSVELVRALTRGAVCCFSFLGFPK